MSVQPLETLRISKRYGGAATTVDRCDPRGAYPVWMVMADDGGKNLAVVHTDPRMQPPGSPPLSTARYYALSHKIDVSYRGADFRMKDDDSGGIKNRHAFTAPDTQKMAWRRSTLSDGVIYFEDANGRRLACYKRRPAGGRSRPVIELYVPAAALDLDLLVVTGMAVVGYVRKDQKEDGEILGTMLL